MNLQELKSWVGHRQLYATGEDRDALRSIGWLLMHQDAITMAHLKRDLDIAKRHCILAADKTRANAWQRHYRP